VGFGDNAERIIILRNFPIAESFFSSRVHEELVLRFAEVTYVRTYGRGVEMVQFRRPAGRVRVYGYMTNYGKIAEIIVRINRPQMP